MILADASVWIDHFRQSNPVLSDLLERDRILMHPFVLGELALGTLKDRKLALARLARLRKAPVVGTDDVLTLVEAQKLHGIGIGYVDAQLLAATLASDVAELKLWTRDRRLYKAAEQLGIASWLPGTRFQ